MKGTTRLIAAAMLGSLGLLGSASAFAQSSAPAAAVPAASGGSIDGVVCDDKGAPVAGAMVSAVGATTTFAVSDKVGHFVLPMLAPGQYLLRAHLAGFTSPRGERIDVRGDSRTSSSIALSRTSTARPVLEAGVGLQLPDASGADADRPAPAPAAGDSGSSTDDHAETSWRLRHARRGVLKDVDLPDEVLVDGDLSSRDPQWQNILIGGPARVATNFFAETPFSGQFNLLTTGSFDTPQQLFAPDSMSRSVADISVGAPAGSYADWAVRGALTQGDVTSWIVAGSYATRAPARHVYDVGMSYSTQRYNAGNPGAFHEIDGSRDAGVVYGFDTLTVSPLVAITYGARYARYDYLADRNLWSPRLAVELSPLADFRIKTLVSRRVTAPGAEEFVPPTDNSLWQPTQRTFSPLRGGPLQSERTTHAQVDVERDFGASTVLVRAFTQQVNDQLITVFGATMPGRPVSSLGHYFAGANGSVEASGWATGFRTAFADRVQASIEYARTRAQWTPDADLSYLIIVGAPAGNPSVIHNVSTSVETDLPETATKILVLYRVSNGFGHAPTEPSATERSFDARFDVQVRQSLPFMDFSSARWEMLVAVKNFFREAAADQSVYDELLVVRPPKRIVGGLTLKF
jgi:hypothetical protein